MSQENPFINEAFLKIEIPKTRPDDVNSDYLKELQEDISFFSEEEKKLILKKINNENQTPEEQSDFDSARNRWWKEKYGFPFANKIARQEILSKKYNSEKENQENKDLQTQLMHALIEGNSSKIIKIKTQYVETYPDQLEGIEALFGMRNFFRKQKYLTKEYTKIDYKKRGEIIKDLTEYQFLFTHFILSNSDDPEFMDLFWKASLIVAEKIDAVKEFKILKSGQLSQVAAYKIMDYLGKNPKLSHPDEDAFNSIDLWTEDNKAVQIKSWSKNTPAIIETDAITFPAIQTNEKNKKINFFNSIESIEHKNILFKTKIKEYGKKIGKDISGYMLLIPYSKINRTTGEPNPDLIKFFEQKLKQPTIESFDPSI